MVDAPRFAGRAAAAAPQDGVGRPRPTLRGRDVLAPTIGIVIGAGIFRTPALVAGAAGSEAVLLLVWAAGGLLSIIGALCYAELASAYPRVGGDFHFLSRAYGPHVAFLYAWARLAVIQTGSIALLAYMSAITSLPFCLSAHNRRRSTPLPPSS